jgi:hypothetical protein
MTRKVPTKPYWEMSTEELRRATKQFDKEFIADEAKPLTASMRSRVKKAKARADHLDNGKTQKTIAVKLEKALLEKSAALAKKKRMSRDALIASGLKALLAAETGH